MAKEAISPGGLAATNPPIMIPGINADGSLYPVEKIEAHVKDLHHLAVSVFIFSGDELLIQQRAVSKYHCGGLWANTCCTHPHFGEDPAVAAERRLKEELGFTTPLQERRIVEYAADVGNGLWERERVHMFQTDIPKEQISIAPNPDEVADTRWITAQQLHLEIKQNPQIFTPWFQIYLERYPDLIF